MSAGERSGGVTESPELLGSDALPAPLDADLIESLCESAIDVRILAGEWLFHNGDPGTDIYVIKSGRLKVIRESTNEVLRVLAAGSVVGELAPLMTTARTAGVRAQRDSHLLRIPADEFLTRLRSDRTASLNIATRLARIVQSSRPRERSERSAAGVVAVLPCHGGRMDSPVRSRFEQLMGELTPIRVIDQQSVDQRAGRSEIAMELDAQIDEAESRGKVVILFGQSEEPLSGTWNHYCARQADRLVLMADPSLPLPDAETSLIGCDLVFLRPPAPAELTDWLDALVPRSHTVAVSEDRYFGLAPLVRRVLGRSTGLVLAGGGARNFAHVGVIEVLLDAGLAIDRVGGCSIGALIGALFALGVPPTDMIEILRHELVQRNALNRVVVSLATLPLRPFLGPEEARTLHGSLRNLFADVLLEELPRPMYTNTVDLPTGEIQTVRRGPAWEAVGVSMTLPGPVPTPGSRWKVAGRRRDLGTVPGRRHGDRRGGPDHRGRWRVITYRAGWADRHRASIDRNERRSRRVAVDAPNPAAGHGPGVLQLARSYGGRGRLDHTGCGRYRNSPVRPS